MSHDCFVAIAKGDPLPLWSNFGLVESQCYYHDHLQGTVVCAVCGTRHTFRCVYGEIGPVRLWEFESPNDHVYVFDDFERGYIAHHRVGR